MIQFNILLIGLQPVFGDHQAQFLADTVRLVYQNIPDDYHGLRKGLVAMFCNQGRLFLQEAVFIGGLSDVPDFGADLVLALAKQLPLMSPPS